MPTRPNDPLLVIARALIFVLLALTAIGALFCLVGLPVSLIMPEKLVSLILEREVSQVPAGTVPLLAGVCALGLATLVASAYFLKQLLEIIGSVAAGDPFVPANGTRLSRMGWTVLAIQVLAVPLGLFEYGLQQRLEPDEAITTLTFADNGLVLALVLFILARVFRHGAAMREDLEGTV